MSDVAKTISHGINIIMTNFNNGKTTSFYFDYSLTENTKKSGKKWKFVFIFLCLALLVAVSSFFAVRQKRKNEKFDKNCYLLVVGNFAYAADAKEVADSVEKVGGAGFVWVDKSFEVVAFAYPTQKDAAKVQKNLESTTWETTIKKINLKKPKLNRAVQSQKNAIDYLWNLIDRLYKISLNFDQENISNAEAHKQLSKISKELNQLQLKLERNEVNSVVYSGINLIKNEIDDFLKKSYAKNLYSSGIKLICVKTIYTCSTMQS